MKLLKLSWTCETMWNLSKLTSSTSQQTHLTMAIMDLLEMSGCQDTSLLQTSNVATNLRTSPKFFLFHSLQLKIWKKSWETDEKKNMKNTLFLAVWDLCWYPLTIFDWTWSAHSCHSRTLENVAFTKSVTSKKSTKSLHSKPMSLSSLAEAPPKRSKRQRNHEKWREMRNGRKVTNMTVKNTACHILPRFSKTCDMCVKD